MGRLAQNWIWLALGIGVIFLMVSIDQPDSGETRLLIENPGPDIAPAHLSRPFDRFYQVDASRQQTSDGAGLGLAITKSIVAAHRGNITVSSANGMTRFELRFPAGPPA